MSEKKIKIFCISDHPMAPSGVGTQTKYVMESLIKTGRYQVIAFGGAIKHESYEPQRTEQYGDDLIIVPVDGYGTQEMVRSVIWNERPDILWFMTDPRFYEWLWDMENEIRPLIPMVYYHVWDNKPYPEYNKKFYLSTDVVVGISKLTSECVSNVSPETDHRYLPHAVDPEVFRKLSDEEISKFKEENFPEDRFTFFWNNRNARRKMSGSLIWWFNEFAEEVGPDKVRLLLHTDPKDPNGQDLNAIIGHVGAQDGRVVLSTQKYPPEFLNYFYNIADCTVNISDAEGFGLATLESLSSETPIIVNMTGGLQEQVTDGEEWFGVGIEPASKALIGSQMVPYIYEDRVSKEDFIASLHKIYSMSEEERRELGKKGRGHVVKNYNFENFCKEWIELMDRVHDEYGSWDNRKHKNWALKEIK
tara:strand:+ start:229 stop:1482 length:1254 start_codon:yes stop_codon:yes gene_type:complete